MTDQPAPSVCQLLADLHAYRQRTMAPADLQVNIDQRQLLEDTADRAAFVKAGDVVPPFSLPEVLGGTIELDRLLADGPVVLLFFRYEGCPACNIALRHYQLELYPALAELGAALVAVSPQVPGRLAAIKKRYGFGFPVVSDNGNGLARRFGISSRPARRPRPTPGPTGLTWGRCWGPASGNCPCPPSS
jgi:peroxiredoxin